MATLTSNGLQIEYETFGTRGKPAILLIMGLGGQLVLWPEAFCTALAKAGYYVIRYDNRDIGLSSKIDHAPRMRMLRAGAAFTLGLPIRAPYRLDDMAKDALGVLDALELKRAHVVGISMGGMIAQILAARHPDRIATLTLMMTSSGARHLPGPSWKLKMRLIRRPQSTTRLALIERAVETWQLIGSPGYPTPEAELREKLTFAYDRGSYPRGQARQTVAIMASGSRVGLLKKIEAPTLIIHGLDDPLVPVAAAHDLARHLPGASLEIIPGMGHDLPATLLARFTQLILDHIREYQAEASAPRLKKRAARQSNAAVMP